ncbi:MAG: peptidase C1 [Candidatus Marinimicrobia bacterium]|nr:peptidase C1 [Candidatus Neomarinimicrobiota bacterium]
MKFNKVLLLSLFVLLSFSVVFAQNDKANYVKRKRSEILEKIRKDQEAENVAKDSVTQVIRDRQKAEKKQKREDRKSLQADFSNVSKPVFEDFKISWHNIPVPQHQSGMCWCFCTTSFLESEVQRITKQEIKLSELYTVYYQYLAKAERFIDERGASLFAEGSESNAVLEMMDKYGAVPLEAYSGMKKYDTHNHMQLFEDLKNYLEFCRESNYWEKSIILENLKNIMNTYIGVPPTEFKYKGKKYTPVEFYQKVLKIKSDDYIEFQSTLKFPFWKQTLFDVPDNWWLDSSYYNIPLDEWYGLVETAIQKGYTVNIGGDVSEPGIVGEEDAAFIPDFILPANAINQYSREYGIYAGTTEDDHGIHLVGFTEKDGFKWFLIKDSGSSSRSGQYEGYYMFREDFIRLKMLSFMVHKDVAEDILRKIQ